MENQLYLVHTSLTPVDSLAVGYFLSSVSLTGTAKKFTVFLESCSLGDASTKSLMQGICRSIDPHSTIKTRLEMHLGSNEIHKGGALHIAELLNKTSELLSVLQLGWNPIGNKGLQTIFESLKQNKMLKYLDVSNCGMTDTGVASLANALRMNNTLEELHIAYSMIHEEGALHIADILRNTSVLRKLLLDGDPIGDEGLQIIFEALKQNTTLKQLSVFRCGMGDAGVASLADALRTNKTLEKLSIHQNDAITEDGITCFVEAVSRHTGLVYLFIPFHSGVDREKLRSTIIEARQRNGLPPITTMN